MRRRCWHPVGPRSEGWGEGRGFRGAQRPCCLAPPGAEDSKSRLEGGGLGGQNLAWDVWASEVTELGATTQNPGCLKGRRGLEPLIGMCDL